MNIAPSSPVGPATTDAAARRPEYALSTHLIDDEWDQLLDRVPGAHFEQLSGWGAVRQSFVGWEVRRILARCQGTLVGGVQVLSRKLGRWGRIGYVSRGPSTLPGYEHLTQGLFKQIEALASGERWLYLVVDHAYHARELAESLQTRGYHPHPEGLPPSGLMAATLLVDLRQTPEQLLAGMRRRSRRNIRQAEASGFTFGLGSVEDLPLFREQMAIICKRRNSPPTPPQPDYFLRLWKHLAPSGRVRLFVVRRGQEIVSTAFAFTFSDTLRVWKVGWSGAYEGDCPNHFLCWHEMCWAKTNGFQYFDFVWIDTHDARLAAQGVTDQAAFRDGTSSFKLSFGGQLVLLPPVQCRFFHPVARFCYQFGGKRLLASPRLRRAVVRYWARKGT